MLIRNGSLFKLNSVLSLRESSSSGALAVLIVLVAAIAVRSWTFFGSDATLSIFLDNTYIFHPLFHYVNAVLANGELPLWIRGLLGGMPLYNSPQFSFFYPFYFFWKPELYAAPTDAIKVATWLTYLHLWICSLNMLIFLRATGNRRYAALFGGVAFAFGACMLTYAHALIIVASYSWVPLAITGVHLLLCRKGGAGAICLTAVSFSLIAMASPSQSLIHAILLAGIHSIASVIFLVQRGRISEIKTGLFRLAISGTLSLAVVGPNLIMIAMNQHEIRWLSDAGHMIGRGAVPYAAFLMDQSSIFELFNIIVPIRTNVAGDSFVGLLLVTLATVALIWRWRSPFVTCYGVAAVYFWLSSTGGHLGLSLINYQIPLLNTIRQPSRNLFIFSFAIVYLASVGFDLVKSHLVQPRKNGNLSFNAAISIIVAFYSALAIFAAVSMNYHNVVQTAFIGAGLLIVIGFVWAVPLFKQKALPQGVSSFCFLVLIVGVWLLEQPAWQVPPLSGSDYATYDNLRMHRALERLAQIPDQSLYKTRLLADGDGNSGVERMLFSMNALWHDVRTFNAWLNPMPNFTMFEQVMDFGNRPTQFYQRLGAKYFICTKCVQPKADNLSYVAEAGGYSIYKDDAAFPDHWIGRPTTDSSSPGSLKATTVSEADMSSLAPRYLADPECASNVERRRHNLLQISVGCKLPGVLVFNELFSPEWQVNLNGKAVQPLLVNGLQLGVPLQQGANVVEFKYYPALYMTLLKISGLSLLVLSVLLAYSTWKRIELAFTHRCSLKSVVAQI